MKSSGNDKQLDERIRDAVGREGLKFDFDKWKAGHQRQIERFNASVSREADAPAQVSAWQVIAKSRLTKFAAAAVVIVGVGILLYPKEPNVVVEKPRTARVEKAPAELLTTMSLNLAYRRGGMEALNEQFEEAEKKLRPQLRKRITIDQLICELEEREEI